MNEEVSTDSALAADKLREAEIGVVGAGTMGASIVACLLIAGHRVRAMEPVTANIPAARERIVRYLDSVDSKYRPLGNDALLERLSLSDEYAHLKSCAVVIETVLEDIGIKHEVIRRIEAHVPDSTFIGTNTSALPVTQIQQGARLPGRVLGLHWGTPPMLPFLEIIRGDETSDETMARIEEFARFWGKVPSIVRKDIRGFVVNRIGYAMFREAYSLYARGIASAADIDRSLRYTLGVWAAYEGLFSPLDENFGVALPAMRELYADLCNDKEIPAFLEEMHRTGQRHFYDGKAEFHPEAERRHLEGIARRTAQELAALDNLENS